MAAKGIRADMRPSPGLQCGAFNEHMCAVQGLHSQTFSAIGLLASMAVCLLHTKYEQPTAARQGREPLFAPCTPLGCIALLDRCGIDIKGKRAVVVGRSNIVGMPVAMLLNKRDATVTICHASTKVSVTAEQKECRSHHLPSKFQSGVAAEQKGCHGYHLPCNYSDFRMFFGAAGVWVGSKVNKPYLHGFWVANHRATATPYPTALSARNLLLQVVEVIVLEADIVSMEAVVREADVVV
eukprot:1162102-Pelagomonas_calceolata.AAC.3